MWCKSLETSAAGSDRMQHFQYCLPCKVAGTLGTKKNQRASHAISSLAHIIPCVFPVHRFTDPKLWSAVSITKVFAVLEL